MAHFMLVERHITMKVTPHKLSILFLVSLGLCSGCGSIASHTSGSSGAYSGVRTDSELLFEGQTLFVIDYPFSAAADTLLLPVDLWPKAPPPTNPIVGWKVVSDIGCKPGEMRVEISPIPGYEAISADVQAFANQLPIDQVPDYAGGGTRRWCYWMESLTFYEDGTGQHAVSFIIPHDGTDWGYALIYDKNNKRVKAVRYVQGHYAC
jgi:uncharacterized protein YceK